MKITIKQLATLEAKLKAELHNWALLDAKASKSLRSPTRNGLAIAEAEDAFKDLRKRVIQYGQALVTGDDGKHPDESAVLREWPNIAIAAIRNLFSRALDKPYAAVFANAEADAGKKPR